MADKKISDLTSTSSLASGDLFEIETSGGNSRKATADTVATYSTSWRLAGTGQTATGVYDQAVDGSKANIDFVGLSAYNELLILGRALTDGTTGVRIVRVSTDNGSTFYSASGDYQNVDSNGVESASTGFSHSTNSTAARTILVHIVNTKGALKFAHIHNGSAIQQIFVASTSDINAIRVTNSGGGNITGGTVRVYAR